MKKFLTFIISAFLLLPVLCFAGCKKSDTINMATYFQSTISYQVYPNYSLNSDLTLKSFLDDKVDHMRAFYEISFTGNREWIYKLNIDYISFELYSNLDTEIEFDFTITNLHNGDQSSTGGNSVFTKRVPVNLVKDKAVEVKIDVKDYIESYTATTTMRLRVTDRSYFIENGVQTGLMYDMLNFMVHGTHNK